MKEHRRKPRKWIGALQMIPVLLSILLMGAHFLRAAQPGLVVVCVLQLALVLVARQRWVIRVTQVLLLVGAALWLHVAVGLVQDRLAAQLPWHRLALILGAVVALTACSAWLIGRRRIRYIYWRGRHTALAPAGAFLLTLALLTAVQLTVPRPMLLAERFLPGAGWIEAYMLAVYAGWIGHKLMDPVLAAAWRRRIWTIFSVVFFAQLAMGLLGYDAFLMQPGKLHFPIPAMILAGPLFRGEGFFMLILAGITLLLVGPAWCSHLCYVGAWDLQASRGRKPGRLPGWYPTARVVLTVLVLGAAMLLRTAGVAPQLAGGAALAFGIGGVATMLLWSRRAGQMTHCLVYCPMGVVAGWAGWLNPFRMVLSAGCDGCGRCTVACRYGALTLHGVASGRIGSTCTRCGDCLGACKGRYIEYRFPGLAPHNAKILFTMLVVALHAATMGLARI